MGAVEDAVGSRPGPMICISFSTISRPTADDGVLGSHYLGQGPDAVLIMTRPAIGVREKVRWLMTMRRIFHFAPVRSFHLVRGMNPGTPVCTTVLNLTFVVMFSRISRMASSGRVERSKLSWMR